MAGLLQDEVPPGIGFQRGDPLNEIEISPVPVQVAGQHHVVGQVRTDPNNVAHPASGSGVRIGRLAAESERIVNVLGGSDHDL